MVQKPGYVVYMSSALRFTNVHKNFGPKSVLKDLTFEIQRGEFLVLLGPNGAGKSTSIALACGLLRADKGHAEIFGQPVGSLAARAQFALVPQEPSFPAHVSGLDLLHFSAAHSAKPRPVEEIVQRLEMEKFVATGVRHMSGGQKRLLSLACAFCMNTELVILDEPTTGLDIEMRRLVWRFVTEYKNAGGTVLMTTHYLAEAEELAERIIVLANGAVAQSGSPRQIKQRYGFKRISFIAEVDPPSAWTATAVGGRWRIDSREPDSALRELVQWGRATDIDVAPLALEDVFLRLIGKEQA